MNDNKNIVEAKYTPQILSEYMGNPLIEALPDIIDDPIKMATELTKYPHYNKNDLNLPGVYRIHMVKNLEDYFKPLSMHYYLEQIISRFLRHGYVNRNPYIFKATTPEYKWQKYPTQYSSPSVTPQLGIFGISGIGKTSLIKKILSMYPQIILHTNYNGDKTIRYQITWLHVETPSNCTPKGLCLNLLSKIDELFEGSTYYKKGLNKRTYELPNYIKTVMNIHSVGILVFDELQNLRGIDGKKQEQILNFFVEISNTVNVPIILIGTLKAIPLFNTEFRNARRICGEEPIIWNRIEQDGEWLAFIRDMFKFQYTKYHVDINDELSDLLYEESQGITDIVVKLFMLAQYRAISSGKEKITKGIISSVAKDCLKPIKPMLIALKNNETEKLEKDYQDIYLSKDTWDNLVKYEKSKALAYVNNNGHGNPHPLNNQIITIASWLNQGGFSIPDSTSAAIEVCEKYGGNIDINLLNKYAFELLSNKKDNIKPFKNLSKKDNTEEPSGILKLYTKAMKEKTPVYDILKNSNFIANINEFTE